MPGVKIFSFTRYYGKRWFPAWWELVPAWFPAWFPLCREPVGRSWFRGIAITRNRIGRVSRVAGYLAQIGGA